MKKSLVNDGEFRLLRLRYLSGWKQRRIAEHLGICDSAVSRQLAKLRKRLGPRWFHDRGPKTRKVRPISLSDVREV